jgi:hypothetical protein
MNHNPIPVYKSFRKRRLYLDRHIDGKMHKYKAV